jgi:hypothetical protein
MKDKDGLIINEDSIRQLGVPNPEHLKDNQLNARSTPAKFMEAFLPVSDALYSNTKCSIKQWCRYTNLKQMLSFAGEKSYPYPDFKPFSVGELKHHLALYVVNGLCPSPQAEMKFKPQSIDPLMAMILFSVLSLITMNVAIVISKLFLQCRTLG